MAILEKLLAGLALKGFDAIAKELKNDKVFQRDLGVFASACKGGIDLEAFALGSHRTVKELKDQFKLENVYIPMRVNQLKPTFGFNAQHPDENRFERNLEDRGLIEEADFYGLVKLIDENKHFKSVLIQGNAGAGKSTFMKYLTLSFYEKEKVTFKKLGKNYEGKNGLRDIQFNPFYIPVLIRLRELEEAIKAEGNRTWVSSFHVSDFLRYKYGLDFESDFYINLFRKAPILLLFDGIDEVPEHKKLGNLDISQAKAQEWIIRQKNQLIENNSLARVILTTRPNKTEKLWREFEVFEIQNLNPQEIECFTWNWYAEYRRQLQLDLSNYPQRKQNIQTRISRLDESQTEFLGKSGQNPLAKIIKNPLLLSLSLIMHAIENQLSAGSVKELYSNFINALLYKWDDVRSMDFYPKLLGSSNWDNLFTLLYRIAYQFSIQDTRQLKAGEILKCLEVNIPKLNKDIQPDQLKTLSRELLEKFRDRAGLLTGQSIDETNFEETLFEFQHQTFQEYLTAFAIHEDDLLNESQLNEGIDNSKWKETIEFYLQLGPSKRFFKIFTETRLGRQKYSHQISFITYYWLSTQGKYFHSEWQKDLETWLIEIFLKSDDLNQTRKAYTSLDRIPNSDLQPLVSLTKSFTHGNALESLKFGLSVNLLQRRGHWKLIRENLKGKIKILSTGEDHNLLAFALVHIISFREFDRDLLMIFKQEAKIAIRKNIASPGGGGLLLSLEYLRDLRDWRNFMNLLDLLNWKDLIALRIFGDLRDLLDLLDFQDFNVWPSLRDLQNWLDLRTLQSHFLTRLRDLDKTILRKVESFIDAQIAHMESLKSK